MLYHVKVLSHTPTYFSYYYSADNTTVMNNTGLVTSSNDNIKYSSVSNVRYAISYALRMILLMAVCMLLSILIIKF